jgi:two-component system chemotaxis response regulator CheB
MNRIRVLVVDDSAFARKVLREVLQTAPNLEIVGTARDGLDALGKIEELDPDVVTLDLVMPNLDGLETLRALQGRARPKVVVVCMAEPGSDLALAALQAGAVDLVHKPTALATDRLYELSAELIFKVEAAAAARVPEARTSSSSSSSQSPAPETESAYANSRDILLIGGSTGGPLAIETLLKGLPKDFPAAVAVVVHLPVGFTQSYAERLNHECALEVREATDGARLTSGRVLIARGGLHLRVERDKEGLFAKLGNEPRSLHQPSVDQLFTSAAAVSGRRALGVVLTGMGDDGLIGSRALRATGASILVEAESTCVVYGMPRVVREAGLASGQHRIEDMARAVLRMV